MEKLVTNFKKLKSEDQALNRPYLNKHIEASEKIEAGWCTQFTTIFKRNWLNEFRQPLDVILKVVQAIFFGVLCIILYYQKGNNYNEIFQNNQGCIFFMVMNTGFSYVFASVNLFNFERPVYIR